MTGASALPANASLSSMFTFVISTDGAPAGCPPLHTTAPVTTSPVSTTMTSRNILVLVSFMSIQVRLFSEHGIYRRLKVRIWIRALDNLRTDYERRFRIRADLSRLGFISIERLLINAFVRLHISGDFCRINTDNSRIERIDGRDIAEAHIPLFILCSIYRGAPGEVLTRIELPNRLAIESGRRRII